MNRITLVLLGPHGSGKTTLGLELSRVLGWPFDEEIGKGLRAEALARNPSAHAAMSQPEFDERVMMEETARDARHGQGGGTRIVETWHPGNLAYAEARSPEVAQRWGDRLRHHAGRTPGLLVVPLVIDRATIQDRLTEQGPRNLSEWLWRVGLRAQEISRQWGLPMLNPVCTVGRSVMESRDQILEELHGKGFCPSIGTQNVPGAAYRP